MAYIKKRNRNIFLIFMMPAVVVLFGTTIYPMIYAGYLSFRSYDLAKPFIPRVYVGWANYREIIASSEFLHTLIVTFKLMAMTLSVQLVLGVGIALLVTQRLPGMGVVRTLLLIPMMISPVIVGLVWLFLYFPELGYLNYFLRFIGVGPFAWITSTEWALWAIAIADIWQWTPFIMMGTAAALTSLSPEPFEAAKLDGNSSWDIFWRVTLPQIRPVIISLLFLRAIDAFKIYDIIFVLTKGGPGDTTEVLSMFIYRQSFTFWRMGVGAAASFVSLIIIVVLITLFFKSLNRIRLEEVDMNRLGSRQAILVYGLLAIVLIVFMTPIYIIASSSIKPSPIMFQKPPAMLFTPTWDHYIDLFTARPFGKFMLNSLIVALGSTAFSLTFGSLAAYAISRIRHKRMNDVAFWILSMRMFPPIAVVVPYYIIFKASGLLDTPLALIIIYSTANIPLTVWLMKGFFDDVPRALEEAAAVDGHNLLQIFWHVTLPLAAPGLAVSAVFCFIFSWNEFIFALMLTGGNAQTVTVAVMSFWSSDAVQWGRIMAGSFIILIPGVIFVLTCQRWLVRGLTMGSVK